MTSSPKSNKSSDHDYVEKSDNDLPKDKNIEKLFRQTRSIDINKNVVEDACNIVGSAWDKSFSEKLSSRFHGGR